jgi:putative NIF3 family GTP cyclohydrolase 1 type 2
MKKIVPVACLLFFAVLQIKAQPKVQTANDVINSIKKNVTCEWQQETVDTFKSGNPENKVTGIAVCMFADMEVLRKAVANNCNLIITHEPVYYNHYDQTKGLEANPVWIDKAKYIADNKLIIWRFHDHIHMTEPDGIDKGMIRRLGWEAFAQQGKDNYFVFPSTDLQTFAAGIQKKFNTHTFRVIGDPDMKISRVVFMAGAPGGQQHIAMLGRDDVDVILAGEAPEWETYMYVNDARLQGKKKAVVFMGHIPSEEGGMEYCAEWLKTFIAGIPVKFIANEEVFWLP